MIRVGSAVCRIDDPRHSARVVYVASGRAVLFWHRAGAFEHGVPLSEIGEASRVRRRHDAEVDAIVRAYSQRRGR